MNAHRYRHAGLAVTARRKIQISPRDTECERGDLNPHGCLAHRILNRRFPVAQPILITLGFSPP
jgi:hypothetical protein